MKTDTLNLQDQLKVLMNMNQKLRAGVGLRGFLEIFMNGEKVDETENLVVTAGRNMVVDRFAKTTPTIGIITHCAVGIGGDGADETPQAVVAGDTTLEDEPTTATRVAVTLVASGSTITTSAEFGANNPTADVTLTEAGLFTADAAGTMYNRVVFPNKRPKSTSDVITLNWTLSFPAVS